MSPIDEGLPREHRGLAELSLLVLQPTPFCNLACDYCYLTTTASKARMSHEVLRGIIAAVPRLVSLPQRLTVVWHAGEPLVMPPDWYRTAHGICAGLEAHGTRIDHAIQTNATLLDDARCEMIAELDIHVGVSLDGPQDLHDRHRVTRKGRGSFRGTMDGIDRLRAWQLQFHVICVLSREALCEPDRLYEFFRGQGITNLAFNIEETEGEHHSSLEGPGSAALHYGFYEIRRVPYIQSLNGDFGTTFPIYHVGQKDARLLIEGGDLWRSTMVTLGSQRADEILVLPNMRGIIATFKKIERPSRPEPCSIFVPVRVWTSEGVTMETGSRALVYSTGERGNGPGCPGQRTRGGSGSKPDEAPKKTRNDGAWIGRPRLVMVSGESYR